MQILAGNARKVSAVRFERINSEEVSVENRGVTRLIPKFWRRRSTMSDDESDRKGEHEVPGHDMSNDCVVTVQGYNANQVSKK